MERFDKEYAKTLDQAKRHQELFAYCASFPENALAAYYLGSSYEEGTGVEKNLGKAVELYSRAADAGYICAYRKLGKFYACGTGVGEDREKALYYLKICADYPGEFNADEHADLWETIAQCYGDADKEKKEEAYNKAIALFSDIALSASDSGNADWRLGRIRQRRFNPVCDMEKAFHHFERGSLRGSILATVELAKCYEQGMGVEQNGRKALSLIMNLVENNRLPEYAALTYGIFCDYGTVVVEAKRIAYRMYNECIKSEVPYISSMAKFCLGVFYYHGEGKYHNEKLALELFRSSDHPLAEFFIRAIVEQKPEDFYTLSEIYQHNLWDGIRADYFRAVMMCAEAYTRSNRTRYADELADMLLAGNERIKSRFSWAFKIYSESKTSKSIQRTGEFYYYGCAVKKNYREAFLRFDAGAQRGDSRACVYLGLCYLNGYGVEKNLEQALCWFDKAAAGDDLFGAYGKCLGAFVVLSNLSVYKEKENNALAQLEKASEEKKVGRLVFNAYHEMPTEKIARLYLRHLQETLKLEYRRIDALASVLYILLQICIECLKQPREGSVKQLREMVKALKNELMAAQTENRLKDELLKSKEDAIAELSREVDFYRGGVQVGLKTIGNKVDQIDIRTQVMEEQLNTLMDFVRSELPAMLKKQKSALRNDLEAVVEGEEQEQRIAACCSAMSSYIDDHIKNTNTIVESERMRLKSLFGAGWDKLSTDSQTSLISASALWKSCADITDGDFDFSGICICATSALETELNRYFYSGFQNYIKEQYGAPDSTDWETTYSVWPDELVSLPREIYLRKIETCSAAPGGNDRLQIWIKKPKSFSLGMLPRLFGVQLPKYVNTEAEKERYQEVLIAKLREYLSTIIQEPYRNDPIRVFTEPQNGKSFIDRCEAVRKLYRNPAAHTAVVPRDTAIDCYQEVIGEIDACKHTAAVTSLLMELVSFVG